jgi:hypothetical protein
VGLAAPAGSAPSVVAGPAASLTLIAPAGAIVSASTVSGPTAGITLTAPSGALQVASLLAGPAAGLTLTSPAGAVVPTVYLAGPTASVTLGAPAGAVQGTIAGPTAGLSLSAPPGVLQLDSEVAAPTALLGLGAPSGDIVSVLAGAAATMALAAPAGDSIQILAGAAASIALGTFVGPGILTPPSTAPPGVGSGGSVPHPSPGIAPPGGLIVGGSSYIGPPIRVLGCPVYEAYVLQRGGQVAVGQITALTQIQWSRVLNDVSKASLQLGGVGGRISQKCCDLLSQINPWEHELGIYRNGELVWVGPITHLSFDTQNVKVSISAMDIFSWMDRRKIYDEILSDDTTPCTTTFQRVFSSATAPDPSFRPALAITPGTISGARQYLPLQQKMAGDVLRELARTVVDFTVVNRTVYVTSVELNLPSVATATDEHWTQPPVIEINGENIATSITVTGPGAGEAGYDLYGIAKVGSDGVDPNLGLIDKVVSEPTLLDQDSIDHNAASRLALINQPLVYTTKGRLSPYFPMLMSELIPCVKIDLRLDAFCRPVLSQYRLHQVDVTVGFDQEDVELTLFPTAAEPPFDPAAFQPYADPNSLVNPVTFTLDTAS